MAFPSCNVSLDFIGKSSIKNERLELIRILISPLYSQCLGGFQSSQPSGEAHRMGRPSGSGRAPSPRGASRRWGEAWICLNRNMDIRDVDIPRFHPRSRETKKLWTWKFTRSSDAAKNTFDRLTKKEEAQHQTFDWTQFSHHAMGISSTTGQVVGPQLIIRPGKICMFQSC